jgi:hypothetical protein
LNIAHLQFRVVRLVGEAECERLAVADPHAAGADAIDFELLWQRVSGLMRRIIAAVASTAHSSLRLVGLILNETFRTISATYARART